jgi:hypothetical protein
MPVAVIHGRKDRVIGFQGGVATAMAVPNAELHVYAEMGHQLAPHLWNDFVRVISRNAARAGGTHRMGAAVFSDPPAAGMSVTTSFPSMPAHK